MSRQKFKEDTVFIVIFPINVMMKVQRSIIAKSCRDIFPYRGECHDKSLKKIQYLL